MIVIGIAGGTGSGKTTFVNSISKDLPEVAVLSLDNYYKDFGYLPLEERPYVNYDHPDAFDWNLLYSQVQSLRNGIPIEQPFFSFHTCTRNEHSGNILFPPKVLIIEGILAFHDECIRNEMNLKIFLDIDSGIRLLRVLERDKNERNHSEEFVKRKYISVLEPMHLQFVLPTKYYADIIVQSQNSIELLEKTFKSIITNYVI